MARVDAVFDRIRLFPELKTLALSQLEQFLDLASRLSFQIQAEGVLSSTPSRRPLLSPRIVKFLQEALTLNPTTIHLCWSVLHDLVEPSEGPLPPHLLQAAERYGLSVQILKPPFHCPQHATPLTEYTEYAGTLFTLHRGAVPIRIGHAYCRTCQTVFHHNFSVQKAKEDGSQRVYYRDLGQYLLVNKHSAVERELVIFWETGMVNAHVSAEAAAATYNKALQHSKTSVILRKTIVWEAFYLHSLWRDAAKRDYLLKLPHHGLQNLRLDEALQARNLFMVGIGQDHWAHACFGCMHLVGPEQEYRITASVIDGVTIGHPCCGVHDCQIPLSSQQHRFCPAHSHFVDVCSVIGCTNETDGDWRTCSLHEHRQYEIDRRAKGKAIFQFRAFQEKSYPQEVRCESEYLDETHEDDVAAEDAQQLSAPQEVKIRGRLSRRWTHNEQLIVACCGIIRSRATFFGSEAITSVKEFIQVTFPSEYPGSRPSYLFYDNNCHLVQHLMASPDPFDAEMAGICLATDVFHAKNNHSWDYRFCWDNCSPITFDELIEGDEWIFNSSACEQINAWIQKFKPIVREMTVIHFNFFMDEMISLHNEKRVAELEREGKMPHLIPLEDLTAQW